MIDERTEELAALYVLDALDKGERQAFEARLAASPELKRRVKELSDGLHAPLRDSSGTPRLDLLQGIHRALDAGEDGIQPVPVAATRIPWTFFWAAAASLMLVLNLFLLASQKDTARDSTTRAAIADGSGPAAGSAAIADQGDSGTAPDFYEARIRRLEADLAARRDELETAIETRDALLAENEEVREFNSEWQREYMRLAYRILPFFEDKDRMSRFTVIELVNSASFRNPRKTHGFAELASRFLTGEGNIAGAAVEEFVGPTVDTFQASSDTPVPSLAAASRNAAETSQPATQAEAEMEVNPVSDEPMGFTVWRDDEQKGFLDIYNLPEPETGAAFLWVRASEIEPYVPVGYLPHLDNGSGSLFYSVDEPGFTPTQIIITQEIPFEPATQPSGQVLLRGP